MRVYVDSCVLIYAVEGKTVFSRNVRKELVAAARAGTAAYSPLVRLECRVVPLRAASIQLLAAYDRVFALLSAISINEPVFELAPELRARFRLKTPDALHAATAIHHRCNELWTNDDRFKSLDGQIKIRKVG